MKNTKNIHNYCSKWYGTLAGKYSLSKIDDFCEAVESETFGYYAIQTGFLSGSHDLLKKSRIAAGFSLVTSTVPTVSKHPQLFKSVINKHSQVDVSAFSTLEKLPIATDNVDLVVASHVLELSDDPHQVLREIDRVLVPEGHCILIGFNPYSISRFKGMVGTFLRRKTDDRKMRSLPRVRDWFSLLGFEVLDVSYLSMRPNLTNKKLFEKMSWLERWGNYAGPIMGNLYVLHVKKQVVSMRPYKKVWKAPAVLTGGKVAINRTAQKIRRENYSKQ